jgi:hypothetical protein
MRVLGPALITPVQQKLLKRGAEITVLRSAVYDSAARRADIGDRFWVREPYIEFIPTQFGCPQNIGAKLPGFGPHLYADMPPYLKPYKQLCRRKQHSGLTMSRSMSRASLEIICIRGAGWDCITHMGNVDGLEVAA